MDLRLSASGEPMRAERQGFGAGLMRGVGLPGRGFPARGSDGGGASGERRGEGPARLREDGEGVGSPEAEAANGRGGLSPGGGGL